MKNKLLLFFVLSLVFLFSLGAVLNKVSFIGLSSDTKPTTLSGQGQTFYETDTGATYINNGENWVFNLQSPYAVGDSTGESLSAVGATLGLSVRGYNIAGFLFEITDINTNVTIGLQTKTGTSGWTDLDIDPTVYTSDGNEGLVSSNVAVADSLRLNFSAESGGTDAIITNIVSTRGKQ